VGAPTGSAAPLKGSVTTTAAPVAPAATTVKTESVTAAPAAAGGASSKKESVLVYGDNDVSVVSALALAFLLLTPGLVLALMSCACSCSCSSSCSSSERCIGSHGTIAVNALTVFFSRSCFLCRLLTLVVSHYFCHWRFFFVFCGWNNRRKSEQHWRGIVSTHTQHKFSPMLCVCCACQYPFCHAVVFFITTSY
jgi:hypothetical protein